MSSTPSKIPAPSAQSSRQRTSLTARSPRSSLPPSQSPLARAPSSTDRPAHHAARGPPSRVPRPSSSYRSLRTPSASSNATATATAIASNQRSTIRNVTPSAKPSTNPPSTSSTARDKPLPPVLPLRRKLLPPPSLAPRHAAVDVQQSQSNPRPRYPSSERAISPKTVPTPPKGSSEKKPGHEKRDSKMSAMIRSSSPASSSSRSNYSDEHLDQLPRDASTSPSERYPRMRKPDSFNYSSVGTRFPPSGGSSIQQSATFPFRAPPSASPFTAPLQTIDSQPNLLNNFTTEDEETPRNSMQEPFPDFDHFHSEVYDGSTEDQKNRTDALDCLEGSGSQPYISPDSIANRKPINAKTAGKAKMVSPPRGRVGRYQGYMRTTAAASSKQVVASPTAPRAAPRPALQAQRGRASADNMAAAATAEPTAASQGPPRSRLADRVGKIGGFFTSRRGRKAAATSDAAPAPSVPKIRKSAIGAPIVDPVDFKRSEGPMLATTDLPAAQTASPAPAPPVEVDIFDNFMKARQAAVEARRSADKATSEAEEAKQTYLATRSAALRAEDNATKAVEEADLAKQESVLARRCARWALEEAASARESAQTAVAAAEAIDKAMRKMSAGGPAS